MDETNIRWRARWLELSQRWQRRLAESGLGTVVQVMSQALQPLGPLAAQVLWFSQPGFALFGQSEAVGALAELLEEPHQPGDPLT